VTLPPSTAHAVEAQLPRLTVAAEALGINLPLSDCRQLLRYLALLHRWNRVYNLTAVRELDEMLGVHLMDCLAALPALRRHADGRALRLLDAGSGGGLPGVVLAICQSGWSVTCVDAVAKKAGFIRQVAAELVLPNLTAVHARVESLKPSTPAFDIVVSRAFSSLADLVRLTESRLAPNGVWLAMKGKLPDQERTELPQAVEVFHVEQLWIPGLDAQRCLVWIRRKVT
jgi:16S rRNA (guanine527-N7)-methyltransferase